MRHEKVIIPPAPRRRAICPPPWREEAEEGVRLADPLVNPLLWPRGVVNVHVSTKTSERSWIPHLVAPSHVFHSTKSKLPDLSLNGHVNATAKPSSITSTKSANGVSVSNQKVSVDESRRESKTIYGTRTVISIQWTQVLQSLYLKMLDG